MARWIVVASRRTVPVELVVDRVIERVELEEGRTRWTVEVPLGAEALLSMVDGVLSVNPIERTRGLVA